MKIADALDAQCEITLAGDVRYFAHHLPPVLSDKERLAAQFIRHVKMRRLAERDGLARDRAKEHKLELVR